MNGFPTPAEVEPDAARVSSVRGRPVVVKLGGSAMEDPAATRGTLAAVARLHALGVKLLVVHGGGKPIDRAMAAAGLVPKKVAGRRFTDDATLEVVVRVLGEINAGIVRDLQTLGCPAVGFTTAAAFPLRGDRLMLPGLDLQPLDIGRVGRVTDVATAAFAGAAVPVLPSLAIADDGGWLNVNADTAAAAVAGAAAAAACLFLTDTPGVLRDVREPGSRIPRLTAAGCRELIARGVIAGGMIPKVEACLDALDAGAAAARILDGRDPHALLAAFAAGPPAGTEILP